MTTKEKKYNKFGSYPSLILRRKFGGNMRRTLSNGGRLNANNKSVISDEEYAAIIERVAENNNAEWNRLREEQGEPTLTVDEEYLRILNDNSYDYRGYYNKYSKGKGNAIDHWTDEFKTVYHPTFSVFSKYSGKKSQYNPEGYVGGTWNNKEFIPAPWQRPFWYANGGRISLETL